MTSPHHLNETSIKEQLLKKLQKERAHRRDTDPKIGLKKDSFPLSSTQKRLFLLHELDPLSTSYNLTLAFQISGELSLDLLQSAFNEVIKRHEILRTSFEIIEGEILQKVHENVALKIKYEEKIEDLESFFSNFVEPFNFHSPPLLRVKMGLISPNEHILLLDMHHIISDAKSLSLLLDEIVTIYHNQPLAPLATQYKDYTLWQKESLSTAKLQNQKDYWLKKLNHELPRLNLTTDYTRTTQISLPGDQYYFHFEPELTESLKKLATEEKVSLYMLLMAIYQVLLHKYTKDNDLIVGSSVEGRALPEYKRLIGAFVNALPIRGFPKPGKVFREFLQEIKSTCLSSLQNQDYPFEELVEALTFSREVGRHPVFETFFDFHYDRVPDTSLQFNIKPIAFSQKSSKFDLSLEAILKNNQLTFYFEFATSLFMKESIKTMANHFEAIAKEITRNPHLLLENINCISKEEEFFFEKVNHLKKRVSTDFRPFYEVFQEEVRKHPQAIAAQSEDQFLTYEMVDEMSSHLAGQLEDLGLVEDKVVAFLLDRNLHFLIALVAVFKTGGSYVPIDPEFPEERISNLIQESGCAFILAEKEFQSPQCPSYKVSDLLNRPSRSFKCFDLHPQNRAYIIFTSGSTGKPKGAMIEHQGMMNHLWIKVKDLNLDAQSVVAQTSSQTFDVSVWQFLVALMAGGKVVVFPYEKAWDPHLLLTTIEKERVSVFETVPSHMNLILEELNKTTYSLSSLKWMILNGEPLTKALWMEWNRLFPSIPMLNAYGPTECSDDVCHYIDFDTLTEFQDRVPIGKVLDNLAIYILDESFSLTPLGLTGELFIEGIGVGRGYFDDPVKTALSFMPFAFDLPGRESKRMYKTGDIARYFSDGTLECIGRADFQVKIRGQRIELGEIEAILSHHEKILQIVVDVITTGTNEKELIGYVVIKSEMLGLLKEDEIIEEIKRFAESKLPRYMVPVFFVILPELPLLTNGKVNRKALPKPTLNQTTEKKVTLPQTETEEKLLSIWKDLLKLSIISIEANFFQIGGHSLLATQLMARILQKFDLKLPLRLFFENPTIASLAKHIEKTFETNALSSIEKLPALQIDRENLYEEFPLTDVQQAYWLGRSGIFELGDVSVHVYSEYDCKNIDIPRLEKAWNQCIQRHDALRLVFTSDGKQRILKDTPKYIIETLDLSGEEESQVNEKLMEMRNLHSHEVFEATQWPLFSISAVKLKNSTRLYISFDSLILDGWSVDLVFSEWVSLYDNLEKALPPLEITFRDYVLGVKSLKNHPLYLRDKKYWMERVDHFPLAPTLPMAKTPKEIKEQKFSRCSCSFEKWNDLQKILQAKNISSTGFLAALFGEVLKLYSNQRRFAINLTLFDRLPLHPQVNEIAGDFTSLTLLEVDSEDDATSFETRAKNLQKQLWKDLDHQFFNGVEFLREVAKKHQNFDADSLFPVVFTSVLGLDNKQNEDLLRIFGNEVYSITQTPQVWLDFKAYEVNEKLVVEWDYVTELFAPGFIEAMHQSYFELLQKLYNDPSSWNQSQILSLPISQKRTRESINQTSHFFETDLLHEHFNKKAINQPHHTAVVSSEGKFSYDFVYRKSNQIGHCLREMKVEKNTLVAVVMEKGVSQILAVLGVLQAGGAYLPIDPHVPQTRLEELLKSGKVSLILSEKRLLDKLSNLKYVQSLPKGALIAIDDPSTLISYPESRLNPIQSKNDLAYVIFTSGSTGTPKGVMMDHEAVSNTILDINARFKIDSKDIVLALSNLNFDLSVYDIFGVLAAGGTIVVPEEKRLKDPEYWVKLLHSEKVTLWNSVPMFMQMLIEYLNSQKSTLKCDLRTILLSGDKIPPNLPEHILKKFTNRPTIVSLGGATEAAIWSIYYEIPSDQAFEKSIPYGYPLYNQQFYVLNDHLDLCPDWVQGELYIGGKGLSKGYWEDLVKTNDSFIFHPKFGRLYKTGDLGRQLPNGIIEFLGRNDFQIKISGYRIEIEEIESHLNQHPDIQQSIVSIQNGNLDNKKLVAHFVPKLPEKNENAKSPLISSPEEVFSFKTKEKNRRHKKENETAIPLRRAYDPVLQKIDYFSRKSYRTFEGIPLTLDRIKEWLEAAFKTSYSIEKPSSLPLDIFAKVLETFSSLSIEGYPWSKYLYPSAGGLYPVQIYLEIGKNEIEGLEEGFYYYDPKEHQLLKIASKEHPEKGISLHLVAELNAIKPIYGELSEGFCSLEAGYMIELLRKAMFKQKWFFASIPPKRDLFSVFELNESHLPLQSIKLFEMPVQQKNEPFIYLYSKKEGWYSYIPNLSEFKKLSKSSLDFSLISKDTHAIFHEASFALFFMQPPIDDKRFLIETGAISQKLMDMASQFNIGTCAIGTIDERAWNTLQEVAPHKKLIHTIFGGPISKSQMESTQLSNEKKNVFQEALRKYLSDTLPKYMVPYFFMPMEKFPLSVNGKIDRQLLPKAEESNIKATIVLPVTEWEKRLHQLWSTLLQIPSDQLSIFDTFFEVGGNSLLLIQLHNLLKTTLNFPISIDKLFQFSTIQSLAQFLEVNPQQSLNIDFINSQANKAKLARQNKRLKTSLNKP